MEFVSWDDFPFPIWWECHKKAMFQSPPGYFYPSHSRSSPRTARAQVSVMLMLPPWTWKAMCWGKRSAGNHGFFYGYFVWHLVVEQLPVHGCLWRLWVCQWYFNGFKAIRLKPGVPLYFQGGSCNISLPGLQRDPFWNDDWPLTKRFWCRGAQEHDI